MNAAAEAERVVAAALYDLMHGPAPGVVVDSPPGAGKSTLVVRAARTLAESGPEPIMVVAQTNGQVDDLVHRLALDSPSLPLGRLCASDYQASERIRQHQQVQLSTRVEALRDRAVLVGTAAKWATLKEGRWQWAIVDEAYQMRSDTLLRIAPRFERALFVGDPGQLDPFSTVEVDRWLGLSWDPMQSAVSVLLANNPDLPQHRLPVSWRLPASAAPVVSEAFYPFSPFRAGTGPGDRKLALLTAAIRRTALDAVVEMAAETGWALYELPARRTLRTEREAATATAAVALRLLERGAVASSSERSPAEEKVTADRIAIGTAHRDQAAVIRELLSGTPAAKVTVDTANRLQGREYDVTIVLHPLSGRWDATAFHLEAGRLCVLTSRHRHACIVVARAGIQELLDAYPYSEPVHLNVPVKFPDGWEANQSVLNHLRAHRISSGAAGRSHFGL